LTEITIVPTLKKNSINDYCMTFCGRLIEQSKETINKMFAPIEWHPFGHVAIAHQPLTTLE